jgi:hypothetical protein
VEEIGRARPKIVSELMETANRFTDREDAYNNKRGRSPEVDKMSRQRQRYRKGDNHGRRNQIAAGYDKRNEDMRTSSFLQETAGGKRSQGTWVLRQRICYMVLVASIMLT